MVKIKVYPDCGNSPRKLFLKDLIIAVANGDENFIKENIRENINWAIAGKKSISGKDAYLKALKESIGWEVKDLWLIRS